MNNDVFGLEGDFITSPEISQIFGEVKTCLFACFCLNEILFEIEKQVLYKLIVNNYNI